MMPQSNIRPTFFLTHPVLLALVIVIPTIKKLMIRIRVIMMISAVYNAFSLRNGILSCKSL